VHQIPPLRSRAGTTTAVPRSSTNPVSLNTKHHQVTEPASRCVSSTSTNTCSRQSLPCLTTNKLPSQHPSCVSLSPHQQNPCRCDGASPCRFTTSLRSWVGPATVTHRTSHFFIPARLAVHRNCLNHAPPKLPQRLSARRQFPPAHELTSSSWMAPLTGGHQETVHFTSLAPLCNSTADVCRTPCRYSRYAREPHHSHHVCSGRGTRPRPVVTERVHHVCYSPCYDLLVLDLWSSF
jgi:hypothetical protein